MQTSSEALTTHPRALTAANEEFASATPGAEEPVQEAAPGWDPYEVWRTRVKAIQDSPDRYWRR